MTTPQLRILGLTLERVADFRSQPSAKSAGLYAALDRRFEVVDVVRPALPKTEHYFNRLMTAHPDRSYWRSRSSLSTWAFHRRSIHAERLLQQSAGRYDLIVQLHTLVSPGLDPQKYRYVLHTDNTYMISERHYPSWAPLRGQQREEWIRRERMVYQNAAFLFPRSEFLRRSMIEDYGCDPQRVIRVGGGSNFGTASLTNKRYDSQIALFVGFDFERKGGMHLLQAWEQVHRQLPQAELWIVGPKRPSRQMPGVRWLGLTKDRQLLAQLYQRATLFVMPSLFEPWGHVFFEAMGQGLACIGSTVCAMPEIIDDGVTGVLVPPGEPVPLASALIELLGDANRAEVMGKAAQQRVLQGSTWDDVVARMAPYIEQAVAENEQRAQAV